MSLQIVRRLIAPLLLVALAACAPAPRPSTEAAPPSLLLVSLDGVPADALFRGHTPHLDALARRGVRARAMRPSYPSLTFPNHYTLVTGLRPDRHGIVDNRMQDPALGRFSLSDRDAVSDGRWWEGGEPLWETAHRHGLRTAAMFWTGSEAAIRGVQPDDWSPFDARLPIQTRVDRVLGWLSQPPARRPRLVTLYFEHVDTAGHDFGPDSPEARAALAGLDAALGRLLAGLAARGLDDAVNLVVVSDHGMAALAPERTVYFEDLPGGALARPVHLGSQAGFNAVPGQEADLARALPGRHGPVQCWRKQDLPARWHFGKHPRVPAVYCQADTGWRIASRERGPGDKRGGHGYDPFDPTMAALFVAAGPDLAQGRVLPAFDNVHVHPLLLALLDLPPMPGTDGDPAVLRAALSEERR